MLQAVPTVVSHSHPVVLQVQTKAESEAGSPTNVFRPRHAMHRITINPCEELVISCQIQIII